MDHRSSCWNSFKALTIICLFIVLGTCGCIVRPALDHELRGSLLLDGSSTVYPIAVAAAERFMELHPKTTITVNVTSSGEGIKRMIEQHDIQIADASRAPKATEVEVGLEKGVRLHMMVIAKDAVVIAVNRANPISGLNETTINSIFFTGTITDWSQLSATKSGTINVYAADPSSSGTAATFNEMITGHSTTTYIPTVNPGLLEQYGQRDTEGRLWVHPSSNMIRILAEDPDAIGYTSLSWIMEDEKSATPGCRAVEVNSVFPTTETILDTSYPLARALYMITDGQPIGLTAEFISYILSPEGQMLVAAEGFIPVV